MKITPNILSIPPYISTTWGNISSLYSKENEKGTFFLTVLLQNGQKIEIPDLEKTIVQMILAAHAQAIEGSNTLGTPISFAFPLKENGNLMDSFSQGIQHNPEQSDLPLLPPGILKKITLIAQVFGAEHLHNLPKAEPNCHCIYCQVMNALNEQNNIEEDVHPEELTFKNWDIQQAADKVYTVTNPIDENEHYSVFLGEPLGCTCGQKNCEHLRAVLNT